MSGSQLKRLVDDRAVIVEKDRGVAFLVSAREIYGLSVIAYLCLDIPSRGGAFVHCSFSDRHASQAVTKSATPPGRLVDCSPFEGAPVEVLNVMRLTPRRNETAWFGYSLGPDKTVSADELNVLASYFHNHMLLRHGNDTSEALLVSARELDCLKWVAAGKSAWEASQILGITERTVRFHLNSAREKLNCTTTTQAVAKAVAHDLISVT